MSKVITEWTEKTPFQRSGGNNPRVIIGMSGGVDSSVAAALLKEQGYDVIGVTMKLWDGEQTDEGCCSLSAVNDARRVADLLDIPYYVMNFEKEFNEFVIKNFIDEYKAGRTPNPCICCNKYVKFHALLNKAEALGADYVATGHYAKISEKDGIYYLQRAADEKKDQTYFLYDMNQNQLSKTLMPLYAVTKDKTREMARQLGLNVANKKDSQEICFVPDGDYASFIEGIAGKSPEGDFIDEEGNKIGTHKGIIHYTVGQRKGLGIALGYPAYVTKIDPITNKITIGAKGSQLGSALNASNITFNLEGEMRCTAKIRYNTKDAPCTVYPTERGVRVVFDAMQSAITPGQAVVFYDGDTVIGGGIIDA